MESSFIRIIITICTVLAVIALFIRNYLKLFWRDFKNSKKMQQVFLEVEQKVTKLHMKTEEEADAEKSDSEERDKRDDYLWEWTKELFTFETLFEVMILVIHPLPYIDYEYEFLIINMLGAKDKLCPVHYMLGDFLFAFMFLRCYFLLRTIMNFSVFSNLNSKKICSQHNFEHNTSFCFKALVQKSPGSTVAFLAVFSILWLSYLLRIFEKYFSST